MERGMAPGSRVVHNSYLHVAAELGLMGLVPYLVILLLTWRDFSRAWLMSRRRNISGDPELRRLYLYALFLQIGFFGSLIGNNFLDSLRFRESWILFACSTLILGFVRARVAELEAENAAAATSRPDSDAPSGEFFPGGTQPVRS
jgi:O-antigen ligase